MMRQIINNRCLAIVGLQWGDEGKAKIIDYFIPYYDYVVRWNGGCNAGHTIRRCGREIKLHMVPSGVVHGKPCIIGPECYINLKKLHEELTQLHSMGFTSTVFLDENATVIEKRHIYEDLKQSDDGIKTTGQGIGPCAADRCARNAKRVKDFTKHGSLGWEFPVNVVDTVYYVYYLLSTPGMHRLLFEGAQSIDLDNIHGQYPYVSQRCTPANILTSFGMISALRNMYILGVAKAYVTRSGNGPMPTEMEHDKANVIRDLGNEYGVTTGRARRIAYLDIPQLRRTIRISGCDSISMNKIDILNKVGTATILDYKDHGFLFEYNFGKLYENIDDLSDISNIELGRFINTIEDLTNIKISMISHGPQLNDVIFTKEDCT